MKGAENMTNVVIAASHFYHHHKRALYAPTQLCRVVQDVMVRAGWQLLS